MKDKISVIMPIYNEEKVIRKTVESLQRLSTNGFDAEFLLVDGMSTDKTREIINAFAQADPRFRLLDNKQRKTPFAMNIGISEATGNYIAILGAHCSYAKDYLEISLAELKKTGAAGCSGKVITQAHSNDLQAMIPNWVMGSPFGVSGSSFRTQEEGFVDTVPYPVFDKEVIVGLGGYNESLHRNQDNDMNQRIREAGHRLYCTWQTTCVYYAPSNLKKLFHYAYRNGFWNAISLKTNPKSMSLRHLIPLFFATGLVLLLLLAVAGMAAGIVMLYLPAIGLFLLGTCLHLTLGALYSIKIAGRDKDLRALLLAPMFFWFHFQYGWGTIVGLTEKRRSE